MTNKLDLHNSKVTKLSKLIESWSQAQKIELINSIRNEFDIQTQDKFALFLIGSLARDEASFSFDRDSYLVFRDDLSEKSKKTIITKLSIIFDQLEIPKCPDLMSFEYADWNGTASQWNARLKIWIKMLSPKDSIKFGEFSSSSLLFGNPNLYNPKKILLNLYSDAQRLYYILYFINLINICITMNPSRSRRLLKDITNFTFLYDKNQTANRRYILDTMVLAKNKVITEQERVFLLNSYFHSISLTFPHPNEIRKMGEEIAIPGNVKRLFKIKYIGFKVYVKYLGELLRG